MPSSLPHFMIATAVSKQHQPFAKKEEKKTEKKEEKKTEKKEEKKTEKKLPKENGDEKKSSPVRERNGVFPHFMRATAASMVKQQPCVKKEEKKTEEKRRVVSVPVR